MNAATDFLDQPLKRPQLEREVSHREFHPPATLDLPWRTRLARLVDVVFRALLRIDPVTPDETTGAPGRAICLPGLSHCFWRFAS